MKLSFTKIEVQRMPGFPSGGFTIDHLCPDINVIHGPNASGKTTTGRAIESLLWPKAAAPERSRLVGMATLDADTWRVELDSGHVAYQKNGAPADAFAIVPAGARSRYRFALHELLAADNASHSEFALLIAQESQGGYDVRAAAEVLGYQAEATRVRTEKEQLENAIKTVRQARESQASLDREEQPLRELETSLQCANKAHQDMPLLQSAIERHKAETDRARAQSTVDEFPPGLARLVGTEAERMAEIDQNLTGEAVSRSQIANRLRAMRRQMRAAKLSADGVAATVTQEVAELDSQLKSARQAMATAKGELASAIAQQQTAAGRLGKACNPELSAINHEAMATLGELARRAETLRGQLGAIDEQIKLIGPSVPLPDPAHLDQGIRYLTNWLAEPEPDSNRTGDWRTIALVSDVLAALAAVLIGILVHWVGWLLLAIPALLLLWAWRSQKPISQRPDMETKFRSLDLESFGDGLIRLPNLWTKPEVEALVERLIAIQIDARLAEKKQAQREKLTADRDSLLKLRLSLEDDRNLWTKRFGLKLDLDEAVFYHLVDNLCQWQHAQNQVAGRTAALSESQAQFNDALSRLNAILGRFGCTPTVDDANAVAQATDLTTRLQSFQQVKRELETYAETAKTSTRRRNQLRRSRCKLFEEAGLAIGKDGRLTDHCRQFPAYTAAKNELRDAENALKRIDTKLAGHEELKDRPIADLQTDLQQASEQAKRIEETNKKIGDIQGQIRIAKQSTDLQKAVANEVACRDALRQARDRNYAAVAGWVLKEYVEQTQRNSNLPGVFRRACDIFVQITNGRYRLGLANGETPSFCAYDTTTGIGHALNELSSGTRVQLLIAVRVAFVETQEQELRLPLILDEALANSDEQRALAIIKAAAEISRRGRQVFYFTAQRDEVGKWKAFLNNLLDSERIPYKVIDLAEVRRFDQAERMPELPISPLPKSPVPSPECLDHAEYGCRLAVPALAPRQQAIGGVHLWYLIEDDGALYKLLSLGVRQWGQLEELVKHGGSALLNADVYHRADARAKALAETFRAWQIGRGKTVDRTALKDSEAVSETFINDITALATEFGGDAARLIGALKEGRVKRFRDNAQDKLREFLEANGYLDTATPLTRETIRIRTLASVAAEVDAGHIAAADIDQLLDHISDLPPVTDAG